MPRFHRCTYFGVLFGAIGVAFAVSGLTLWLGVIRPQTTALNQAVLGITVHVLFGYIVVMSGIVVSRSSMSLAECLVTAKWCFGGTALMSLFVLWGALPELRSGTVTAALINELVLVGSVGAAAGVLVGLNRGQAMRNRRLVERKDEREETLVFLLRLLGHDIQNHLVAITDHTDIIERSNDTVSPNPVDGIRDRTAGIEQLLETANIVLESETDDGTSDRIDLSVVLREQLTILRSNAPAVEIRSEIDDELYVEANQFVDELFYNVFDNAVEHNSTADLTVSVSAVAAGDRIEIEIEDDGGGVPDEILDGLFDPGVRADESSGDGIGLYLVRKLAESYGGSISVYDRDPSGTRFRLRFPRARDERSP